MALPTLPPNAEYPWTDTSSDVFVYWVGPEGIIWYKQIHGVGGDTVQYIKAIRKWVLWDEKRAAGFLLLDEVFGRTRDGKVDKRRAEAERQTMSRYMELHSNHHEHRPNKEKHAWKGSPGKCWPLMEDLPLFCVWRMWVYEPTHSGDGERKGQGTIALRDYKVARKRLLDAGWIDDDTKAGLAAGADRAGAPSVSAKTA